ncbi:MAG: thioredoxin domain-containing protein [Mageeibacillus sp.]|jgi:hypothetical protein|nr:thioredoxin domain-containing protein [Mageeibacillus sp.]MCI1264243.1 thioredoxin domain-containing protein [Saccharofermentans sp.]MCI1770026.1 thioredoxin domain-containing protein [Mageeibacillus sp.]MCI2043910.1 thioredoxin domain-containing protein [Mageeibacillus sp.]
MNSRKVIGLILTLCIVFTALAANACSGSASDAPLYGKGAAYYDDLGSFSYNTDASCLVYEAVDGETDDSGNPLYGIQYREITNLDDLLSRKDISILIYFYSSMASDTAGITAAVEDIAAEMSGSCVVIALDAMEHADLTGTYEIKAVPDFVLLKDGADASVFGSGNYSSWDVNDVTGWLEQNGMTLQQAGS